MADLSGFRVTKNENEKEFLIRVINSYYNSKGLQKPADAKIQETAKAD